MSNNNELPTLLSPRVYCTICSIPILNFKIIEKSEAKIAVCSCGKRYYVKAEHFKFMKGVRLYYEEDLYKIDGDERPEYKKVKK